MFKNCLFEGVRPPSDSLKQEASELTLVEAQQDFVVGPDKTTIIKKGERFKVQLDQDSRFFVKLPIGSFGACTLTPEDWIIVQA